jgi:polysaccharide export outer membrane protein
LAFVVPNVLASLSVRGFDSMIHAPLSLALFCALMGTGLAQTSATPKNKASDIAKDLDTYIRDARKLGLGDGEVRQNAIKAGFKTSLVDMALKTAEPSGSAESSDKSERPDHGVPDEYVIGEADVLQVAVWKEAEASVASVVVRADGKITLPFIKDVAASGLTPAQAETAIATKLKPFYTEPDVTVVVREVHSKKIYLVGAVRKQGVVELRYPMTVLQAITEAGGPTDFAKRKKIYILRTENGKQFRLDFNYDEVIQGKNPEQNVWVRSGDYIYIPQ